MSAALRSLVPLLSIFLGAAAAGDESRFDPQHRGSHLGVTIELGEDGLRVDTVHSGGAADRAGVKVDDVLLEIGQWRWTEGAPDLADFLANHPPSSTKIRLQRDGEDLDLDLEPDPRLATTAREIARRLASNRLFRRSKSGDLGSLSTDLFDALRATSTREAGYAAMNEVIDRFDISHTAVLTPWVVENLFGKGEHYHLGMFVQAVEVEGETRHFVRSLMFGSPAREAGLQIGDEIVSVNEVPIATSPRRTLAGFEARRRMLAIQVDRDETVTLGYRGTAGGEVRAVDVTADQPIDAVASARGSVRLIEAADQPSVGYLHFWNVMSKDNVTVLKNALEGPLADAAALAIDLRGRGGQIAVINALANMIGKEDRPVALLIDREARSAKEMLAHRLKGRRGITLVGETTAGAVLPAHFHDLPDGARLMLPAQMGDATIRLFMRGDRLEGVGAVPDVRVDAPLPYRAGRDPILDRSIGLLQKQAEEALVQL